MTVIFVFKQFLMYVEESTGLFKKKKKIPERLGFSWFQRQMCPADVLVLQISLLLLHLLLDQRRQNGMFYTETKCKISSSWPFTSKTDRQLLYRKELS